MGSRSGSRLGRRSGSRSGRRRFRCCFRSIRRSVRSATYTVRSVPRSARERRPGVGTFRPASPAQRAKLPPPIEKKRGDGLERRPPVLAAGGRERRTPTRQKHGDGSPTSGRHRGQKRGDGLERRPPVGIARERETGPDDAAPCQRGWPHPLPAPDGMTTCRFPQGAGVGAPTPRRLRAGTVSS